MSQIFDALQRAEGERTGKAAPGEVRATDVLKRVEHRFAVSNGATVTVAIPQTDKIGSPAETQPANRDRKPHLVSVYADAEPFPEIFDRFPTLKGEPASTSKLVSVTQVESAAAEAFRLLAIRLNDFKKSRQMKKILVTSSIPQEGKSLVAANLACALSKSEHPRTILLEGDLRRPTLSTLFEVETGKGIAEFLEGKCALHECIYFVESAGVWLLPAGRNTINPQDQMQSDRLASLFAEVSMWFDWVVIDSPPVLPMADTSIWMRLADGILLTTRQGKSEKKALKSCIDALDQDKIIGAVLNSARIPEHADYYYGTSEIDQK